MQSEILIIESPSEDALAFRIDVSDKGVAAIVCLDSLPAAGGVRSEDGISQPVLRQAIRELREYFAGERRSFEVGIDLQMGTEFQREVWAELRRIPYGQTITYGRQAQNIGRPKAVRAVGGANGKNPLPIIIPCHRVLASTGKLQGFSGGLDLKRRLLAVEGLDVHA